MIKKPKLIYLIALWLFIQSAFYRGIPIGIIKKLSLLPPNVLQPIHGAIAILIVILIVGLIQLRNTPRLLAISLFIISSLMILKIYSSLLFSENPYQLRTYLSYPIMFLINMACIYYLFSKKFVVVAKEYRIQADKLKESKNILKQRKSI
jgi:hypothetical protein